MIGVAFALQKTFGTAPDVEGEAFVQVVRDFARLRGLHLEAAGSPTDGPANFSPDRLREKFSAALRPYLLSQTEDLQLEAMFRMEAARLVTARFVPFPDVAGALSELATLNVPCVALSGGWPSIDQRKAQIVGFSSPIVFAEDLGITSAAPAAFARIAEMLRLPADRIWFVGTDVRDEMLPAAAVGMRTIWINRDGETFPPASRSPDATVTAFVEILDVLSGPYTRGLLALRQILRTALDWRPGHFISEDDTLVLEELARGEDES